MTSLSLNEAVREADRQYLHEEQTAQWYAWKGKGVRPWWIAGLKWVEAVITAFAHLVLMSELRFDDSLRGRLYGEARKQAVAIYERKIWHNDAPLVIPAKRRKFVNWVARSIAPLLASIELDVLVCTEPDDSDEHQREVTASLIAQRRKWVKDFRVQKGLMQPGLARLAKTNVRAIQGMIREDTTRYSLETLARFLRVMSISEDQWYGRPSAATGPDSSAQPPVRPVHKQ